MTGGEPIPVVMNLIEFGGLNQQSVTALSGASMVMVMAAPPGTTPVWTLAYEDNAVMGGHARLDPRGLAKAPLVLPTVRHRTVFTLVAKTGGATARRDVVVLPGQALSPYLNQVNDLAIGVIDNTGQVQAAFRAEGVNFTSLETDLQRDYFTGSTVVLAGFGNAESLLEESSKFRTRLAEGTILLIMNPPAGWSDYGVKSVAGENTCAGQPNLASGFGRLIHADDLGNGPWKNFVEVRSPALVLAGVRAPSDRSAAQGGDRHGIVVARQVGRGSAFVAVLPQLDDPVRDAVGRFVLNEAILWTLSERQTRLIMEDGK